MDSAEFLSGYGILWKLITVKRWDFSGIKNPEWMFLWLQFSAYLKVPV